MGEVDRRADWLLPFDRHGYCDSASRRLGGDAERLGVGRPHHRRDRTGWAAWALQPAPRPLVARPAAPEAEIVDVWPSTNAPCLRKSRRHVPDGINAPGAGGPAT